LHSDTKINSNARSSPHRAGMSVVNRKSWVAQIHQ
jgi:hypothetical protein